ncbi:hypothetical protein ACLB1G_15735 [Oxalobacteraceae bacterium A2-2]
MSERMLHLMSASRWDEVGAIVGDRVALLELRAAIDEALRTGAGGTFSFHSDGEPYALVVALERDMTPVHTAYAAEKPHTRSHREKIPMRAVSQFNEGYRKALVVRDELRRGQHVVAGLAAS